VKRKYIFFAGRFTEKAVTDSYGYARPVEVD